MRYPILIEEGCETIAFGVVIPDLPGCFSAGGSLDDAMNAAKQAAAAWIDMALDTGTAIPAPSRLEDVRQLSGYEGWTVAVADLTQPRRRCRYARRNSIPAGSDR